VTRTGEVLKVIKNIGPYDRWTDQELIHGFERFLLALDSETFEALLASLKSQH